KPQVRRGIRNIRVAQVIRPERHARRGGSRSESRSRGIGPGPGRSEKRARLESVDRAEVPIRNERSADTAPRGEPLAFPERQRVYGVVVETVLRNIRPHRFFPAPVESIFGRLPVIEIANVACQREIGLPVKPALIRWHATLAI